MSRPVSPYHDNALDAVIDRWFVPATPPTSAERGGISPVLFPTSPLASQPLSLPALDLEHSAAQPSRMLCQQHHDGGTDETRKQNDRFPDGPSDQTNRRNGKRPREDLHGAAARQGSAVIVRGSTAEGPPAHEQVSAGDRNQAQPHCTTRDAHVASPQAIRGRPTAHTAATKRQRTSALLASKLARHVRSVRGAPKPGTLQASQTDPTGFGRLLFSTLPLAGNDCMFQGALHCEDPLEEPGSLWARAAKWVRTDNIDTLMRGWYGSTWIQVVQDLVRILSLDSLFSDEALRSPHAVQRFRTLMQESLFLLAYMLRWQSEQLMKLQPK